MTPEEIRTVVEQVLASQAQPSPEVTMLRDALETLKRDAASYQREIELLKGQMESKDALIAAKDEMLNFLRGGYNRPN